VTCPASSTTSPCWVVGLVGDLPGVEHDVAVLGGQAW
jgi:hypothetical protein